MSIPEIVVTISVYGYISDQSKIKLERLADITTEKAKEIIEE